MAFVEGVTSSFKKLDTLAIDNSDKLENIINQLGRKMLRNQEFSSTPNSGGWTNVVDLSTTTEHQEVVKTGNTSRILSRTSSDPFLTKKFMKSPIKEMVLGS